MKKIIKYITLSVVGLLVGACEFGDTNVDPARPLDVGMPALLPALQTGVSFTHGGEYVTFNSLFMQQLKGGTTAQQADFEKYNIGGQDMDGMWQNMYTNGTNMAYILINKAIEADAPYYSGIGRIMMAAGIGVATDSFGDVPYSSAFRADEGIIADFDDQENVYAAVQKLLDDAIVDLSEASSPGGTPGSDDLIYGGDVDKWIKAARSLKAKYYLHASKVDPDAYTNALAAINAGAIDGTASSFQQFFGTSATEPNPRYEFDVNRGGNILMGDYFINKLTANADPRLAQLNSVNAGYWTSINSPVPYITYSETKMIEAEAILMSGGTVADARTAFMDGAEASVTTVSGLTNVDADVVAYLNALGNSFDAATTNEERLEVILNEKFVATYSTGVEGWVDYRRTGYPSDLVPHPDGDRATNPGGGIPRRLPYPENERLLNTNIPFTEVNMQVRFWWDPA